MRITRMLFGLPLASLLFAAALTFFAPAPTLDFGPPGYSASYAIPDLSLTAVYVDHVATLDERTTTDVPADAGRVAYTASNQPLSAWRFSVDAYRHVDPHIRAV